MKSILSRLFEHERLSREEAKNVLIGIARAEYNPIQVASFLTVYQMRAIALQELQGFREALLELCIPFDVEGPKPLTSLEPAATANRPSIFPRLRQLLWRVQGIK